MQLAHNVFDIWAFRKRGQDVEFLLLYTAIEKAERHFNGGTFWQIPSGLVEDNEPVVAAVDRVLGLYGQSAKSVWAGEHAYTIYNRRFDEMQIIGVYAAEVEDAPVRLTPSEHSESGWFPYESCLEKVHYRGLKDGLRSVHEYVTGTNDPAKELCLYGAKRD